MNPTKKIYLSIGIGGLAGILLIVFLIYPFCQDIKRNSDGLLSEKKKIILAAKEKENLMALEGTFQSYQSDFNKIDNLFINAEIPVEFVNFLEENASLAQVKTKISGLTAKETKKDDPWPSISLQILVTGSFEKYLKFVDKLENSPYLIQILGLNIKKGGETDSSAGLSLPDVSAFLTIKVFTK